MTRTKLTPAQKLENTIRFLCNRMTADLEAMRPRMADPMIANYMPLGRAGAARVLAAIDSELAKRAKANA